jgi:competence protein ComEA
LSEDAAIDGRQTSDGVCRSLSEQEMTPEAELDPQNDVVIDRGSVEPDRARDREQTALAVLLLTCLTFLGWRYYEVATRQPRTFVIEKASDEIGYQIEINSATWFELSQLEAIGPVLAKRIVADRDTNGPFRSIDDLQRVKGIGPRTVDRNRRWMRAAVVPAN